MKKTMLCLFLILTLLGGARGSLAEGAAAAEVNLNDYFTSRDLRADWDADEAVAIALTGGSASCESDSVSVDGGSVTITAAGVYVLSGSLAGSVTVRAGDADKVQLVLEGVQITASGTAAIYVENADKTFITLAPGSSSVLEVTAFEEGSEIDGVIFAKDDLVLNGSGQLTIASPNHGVVCKDDLKVTGGVYRITAAGRGMDANDSVRIYDGSITNVSGKDAIRAKSDEADKGYLLIAGGAFSLTVGGGAQNAAAHSSDMGFGGPFGGSGRGAWGSSASYAGTESADSAKGLKASGALTVLGGAFTLDTADDALHTDSDLTIRGGDFAIASGDDGMHADGALTILDGIIAVTQSYEGLEAQNITVAGGTISVTASDDGLNAAGGNDQSGFGWYDMFASDGASSIVISGGSLYVNAQGDGIDSNGDLYVTGGAVLVSGPTNSGNGALDYNGTASISGGTFIAAGAAGMAENFGSGSTQVSALVSLSGGAGSTITVYDASGCALLSGTVEKSFNTVVISSPQLTVGETYTVSGGSGSVQLTVTDIIMGGGMGFGGGGRNGNPGGQQPGGHGGGRRW